MNFNQWFKKHFGTWEIAKHFIYDIIVILIFAIIALTFNLLKPHHMDIPLGEQNANVIYPYKSSTVPSWACTLMAYATPLILIVLFGLFRKSPRYIVFGITSLIMIIAISTSITNMGKIYAGRPRPHFYERVKIGEENDAWKSFPSGHSSTIFSGMVYTSMLIAGQLKIFSNGHESWKMFIVIVPWFVAGTVAISRTRDYHHNFSDIVAGTLIGVFSALIVYFMKYKKIDGPYCYQMKIEEDPVENGEENIVVKDEEQGSQVNLLENEEVVVATKENADN